jgi:hypothetical protein
MTGDSDIMAEKIDYNCLGQALDTTWGRSSTPKTSTYSVKFTMMGPDRILASYAAVVNFGTERQMIDMKRGYSEESESVIEEYIKQIKKNYKELSGESLTAKQVSSSSSLEIINYNVHNPKRTAYYRRKSVFEIA